MKIKIIDPALDNLSDLFEPGQVVETCEASEGHLKRWGVLAEDKYFVPDLNEGYEDWPWTVSKDNAVVIEE